MRTFNYLSLVAVAALVVACDRGRSADDALKNDLALAAQAQSFAPQQFVSPEEGGYAPQSEYAPYAPRTVQPSAQRPVVRQTSAPRRTTSSGTRSTGTVPAREPVEQTHTARDAAIGATAGAILGATIARDKVKGGLIGAAAGGVIGAVIGKKVDITRY